MTRRKNFKKKKKNVIGREDKKRTQRQFPTTSLSVFIIPLETSVRMLSTPTVRITTPVRTRLFRRLLLSLESSSLTNHRFPISSSTGAPKVHLASATSSNRASITLKLVRGESTLTVKQPREIGSNQPAFVRSFETKIERRNWELDDVGLFDFLLVSGDHSPPFFRHSRSCGKKKVLDTIQRRFERAHVSFFPRVNARTCPLIVTHRRKMKDEKLTQYLC